MAVLLIDGQTSRTFEGDAFPLAIGLTADLALAVGQAAEAAPALWLLSHSDGLSIQPERSRTPVRYNGVVLEAPAWLREGDAIAVGPVSLTVSLKEGSSVLTVVSVPAEAGARPGPEDDEQAKRFGSRFGAVAAPKKGWATPGRITLGLFALLFLGAAYVIAASPLYVRFTPEPDWISVRGVLPAVPVGDRYLAFPGDYVVEAGKEGYRPFERTVSIPYGSSPAHEFTLQKLPGRLQVTTPPVTGAKILIDGAESGTSPATIEVEAGAREIRITAERYLPETRRLEILGVGELQSLDVPLQPAWGTLSLSSVPDKAIVRLAGKDLGETPLRAELLQGTHELEFIKEGWKPARRSVEVKAGTAGTLPVVELEKIDGTLELRSEPAGAAVQINGQFRGQTPLSLVLVSDRDYQLALSKAGYESATRTVRVEGGRATRLSVSLPEELGTVFITANPPGSTLTVNGRASGSATQRLTLQTVPQALEIAQPGYETWKGSVTPQRGVPKRLDVTLKTLGDALKERARAMTTPGGQKLALIYIATPARFTVGSSRRDAARRSNEVEYPVELRRSFVISEKEVTNGEYRKFKPSHASGSYQTTSLDGADQPVVNVSWDDAARYANWLSEQEKLAPAYKEQDGKLVPVVPPTNGYRLPTEAEWEFAARYEGGQRAADQALAFVWGAAMPPAKDSGNFAHEGSGLPFAIPGYADAFLASAPVGRFAPNKAQLYDLGGNVSEWCHDYYDVPAASSTPKVDPTGPASGRFHVIKGASWRTGSVSELRLAYRDYAEKPRDDLGFRVARYVDAKE